VSVSHPHVHKLLGEGAQACGLDEYLEGLLAAALVAVDLAPAGADDLLRLGNSRLGGCPDLPVGAEWPAEEGRLHSFVLQLDLASVPRFGDGPLPAAGRLYLFLGDLTPGKGVQHRVLFRLPTEVPLRLVSVPDGAEFLNPDMGLLPAHRLRPRLAASLPAPGDPGAAGLELPVSPPPLLERYVALMRRLSGDAPVRLLGHAFSTGEDAAANACFHLRGLTNPRLLRREEVQRVLASWEGKGQPAMVRYLRQQLDSLTWYEEHRAQVDREVGDWRCLLRVRSAPAAGFQLWGDGVLNVMVRREDLQERRFDRTYAELVEE
jgi:hypothetical protein